MHAPALRPCELGEVGGKDLHRAQVVLRPFGLEERRERPQTRPLKQAALDEHPPQLLAEVECVVFEQAVVITRHLERLFQRAFDAVIEPIVDALGDQAAGHQHQQDTGGEG